MSYNVFNCEIHIYFVCQQCQTKQVQMHIVLSELVMFEQGDYFLLGPKSTYIDI